MTYNIMNDDDARSIASLPSLHELHEIHDLSAFQFEKSREEYHDVHEEEEEDDLDDDSDTYADLPESENDDSAQFVIDAKRSQFMRKNSKDISMDLNDLLAEMEEEQRIETSQHDECESIVSTDSLSLNLNEDDDSPQRIGSKLQLEDLPSQTKDWGWGSFGSLMGSFSKLGSSRRSGSSRRLGDSSRRLLRRKKSSRTDDDDDNAANEKADLPERRKKKVVRFKKFETVLPSMESFRRLHQDDFERKNGIN